VQNNGLLGLPQPGDVQQLLINFQQQLQDVIPRFRELAAKPGFEDVRMQMMEGLRDRMMARAIKLMFGPRAEDQKQLLQQQQSARALDGAAGVGANAQIRVRASQTPTTVVPSSGQAISMRAMVQPQTSGFSRK
jgi:hypothetical protein